MKRVLDLYCHKGGAGMGYHLAGFEVVGVDIEDTSAEYPFEFWRGDAIELLKLHGHEFDFIHASPPCQQHSTLTKGTNKGRHYIDLIGPTREVLEASGKPWVIENVGSAPVRRDLVLCGEMFGLGVIRHRFFEFSGVDVEQPEHIRHRGKVKGIRHGVRQDGPYYGVHGTGGDRGTIKDWQQAMGMTWVTDRRGLSEAIPPAYTRYIGEQIVKSV